MRTIPVVESWSRFVGSCLLLLVALLVSWPAAAQPIQVTQDGDDLLLTRATVFTLRFDKSQGGTITRYYDLAHDPGATTNLAAAGGSLYDGLYFVMFKQESPEMWTASFRSSAESIEVVDAQPQTVKVRVQGSFPDGGFGLPASYDVMYTVTADAKIYIRSRVRFEQAYANHMQIRQALALSSSYATSNGWIEFSQDQDLTPWYYQDGDDDDYIGARIAGVYQELQFFKMKRDIAAAMDDG